MAEVPDSSTFNYDAASKQHGTFGGLFGAMGDHGAVIKELPVYGEFGAQTIITGDLTLPTIPSQIPAALYPNVVVDGEGAAADSLERIDIIGVRQGQEVRLRITDASRPITLVHEADDPLVDGNLQLTDAQDWTLTRTDQSITLKLNGTLWEMVDAHGFAEVGGVSNPGTKNFNGGNFSYGAVRPHFYELSDAAYTINQRDDSNDWRTRDTNQVWLIARGATEQVWQLPGSGASLAIGDMFHWSQAGAGQISFEAGTGAAIIQPDGATKSAGQGAVGGARVVTVSPTVEWELFGGLSATASDAEQRDYVKAVSASTVETDSGSTARKVAQTLQHTPGDNETWAYFGRGWLEGDSSNSNNSGDCALQINGVDHARMTRPRYQIHQDPISFLWGASYGVSPGEQTLELEIDSSDAAYQTRLKQPGLIGIKLTTNESLATSTSLVTNSTTTFADVLSHTTGVLPAGDYIILAGCQWETATLDTAEFVLEVDSVEVAGSKREMARNGPTQGYYAYAYKVTLTNAAHTIKLRHRKTGSADVESRYACIIVLDAAAFKDVHYAEAQAETGLSNSTGWTNRVSLAASLRASWEHLLIVTGGVYLSTGGGTDAADLRATRNGSLLLEEVNAGTRTNGNYSPNGIIMPFLVTQQSPTDSFNIETKSAVDTLDHKAKGLSLTALALAPI